MMLMYLTFDQLMQILMYSTGLIGLVITTIKFVIYLIDRNNKKR